ncbi:MAG: DUF3422 family protein [Burkholderiaceae bacterium]|jgi:uncharacterized membrane-anchored protein
MKSLIQDHAAREALHEEVHARPPIALWPEERVYSQSLIISTPDQRAALMDWINRLTSSLGVAVHPVHGQTVRVLELSPSPARLLLKWELHGEFCGFTVYAQSPMMTNEGFTDSRKPLQDRVRARLSELGIESLNPSIGERMAAVDIVLKPASYTDDAAEHAPLFSGNTLVGSTILATQKAQVWTDFQLDQAGFVCMLVTHQGIGSRQAGRVVQRLIDIDTYRMMAMLGIPRAKALSGPLREAESQLASLVERIAQAGAPTPDTPEGFQTDEHLLTDVTAIAARVEEWISLHGLRFTASEAYTELVRRSLSELRETAIPGVQNLTEFMDRRFEPAMRTCRWTQRRLQALSDRVSRTTQILRTRIEFVNERQTQALLASMDRRAKLQLKLQQTVEGLSLVVLTYYAVGLIGYMAKGLQSSGIALPVELISAIAVPVIAGLLYLGIRRARRLAAREGSTTPR